MLGEHSDSTSDVIQKAVKVIGSLSTLKLRRFTILTLWRNGSASDSRSEGCVFESRQGQKVFSLTLNFFATVVSTFLAIHGEYL